jgi:hypothetical protein
MIWPVPEAMRKAISTNPLDRQEREREAQTESGAAGGVEDSSANG